MQITRQTEYALRTIYHLSRLDADQRASTMSIAEAQNIPLSFLSKIISKLSIAGLTRTSRGARGGVLLACPPSDISVLDVMEAIEGPIIFNNCEEDLEGSEFREALPLHNFLCDTQLMVENRLRSASFDQFE